VLHVLLLLLLLAVWIAAAAATSDSSFSYSSDSFYISDSPDSCPNSICLCYSCKLQRTPHATVALVLKTLKTVPDVK
jgi:hypothetical protein